MKIKSINISLEDWQFKKLVNGEDLIINHHCSSTPIHISFKGISFNSMINMIREAVKRGKKYINP